VETGDALAQSDSYQLAISLPCPKQATTGAYRVNFMMGDALSQVPPDLKGVCLVSLMPPWILERHEGEELEVVDGVHHEGLDLSEVGPGEQDDGESESTQHHKLRLVCPGID